VRNTCRNACQPSIVEKILVSWVYDVPDLRSYTDLPDLFNRESLYYCQAYMYNNIVLLFVSFAILLRQPED